MFPVVIPVAGLGTRSLPASKAVPKEMLPIHQKPIIQYIVEEAAASGVRDVVFVTSKGKTALEDHFDIDRDIESILERRGKADLLSEVQKVSRLVNVQSVRQKEALGLGHAVLMAKNMVSTSHFFVMLGDEVTDATPSALEQMLAKWKSVRSDAGVICVMRVPRAEVSKYGICDLQESDFRIRSCIEKPSPDQAPSEWAITGRYLLPKDSFQMLEANAENFSKSDARAEIQLTDVLSSLAQEGRLFAVEFQGHRFDAGDRWGYLRAQIHYYIKSEGAAKTKELLKEFL